MIRVQVVDDKALIRSGFELIVDAAPGIDADEYVMTAKRSGAAGFCRSNAEIGARVHLSTGTVKDPVGATLTKLRVGSRVQAALLAERARLLRQHFGTGSGAWPETGTGSAP